MRPSTGPGWGGDKKGSGNHKAGPGRPRKGSERQKEIYARKVASREDLYLMLTQLAEEAEWETTRLHAINALLNRIEGQPVAKNLNVAFGHVANMTDEELDEELRRLDRKLAGSRVAEPHDSGEADVIPEPTHRTVQ